MRHALWLLAAVPVSCLFTFCGGDDTVPPVDGGVSDVIKRDSSKQDAPGDLDSGSDAADDVIDEPYVSLTCLDPSTCEAGAPLCCGTLVTGAGMPPFCPLVSVTTACTSTCNTMIGTCGTTEVVRLCTKPGDCTEMGNPACCEFKQGSQNVTFCTSIALKGAAVKCF